MGLLDSFTKDIKLKEHNTQDKDTEDSIEIQKKGKVTTRELQTNEEKTFKPCGRTKRDESLSHILTIRLTEDERRFAKREAIILQAEKKMTSRSVNEFLRYLLTEYRKSHKDDNY